MPAEIERFFSEQSPLAAEVASFRKDLPVVRDALKAPVTVALLKGRAPLSPGTR